MACCQRFVLVGFAVLAVLVLVFALVGCGGEDDRPEPAPFIHYSLTDIDVVGLTQARPPRRSCGQPAGRSETPPHGGGDEDHLVFVPDNRDWIICSQRVLSIGGGNRTLSGSTPHPRAARSALPNLVGRTFGEAQTVAEAPGSTSSPKRRQELENLGPDWIICDRAPPTGHDRTQRNRTVHRICRASGRLLKQHRLCRRVSRRLERASVPASAEPSPSSFTRCGA